jgi:integrase
MRSGNFKITKHSKEYWFAKVYRPRVRGEEVDNYAVRLFHRGSEKRLSLGTPNRGAAADLAREMFVYLSANGWTAFFAKYRSPDPPTPASPGQTSRQQASDGAQLTVGQFLMAVRVESELKHKTISDYEGCLRLIVSEVLAMGEGNRRRQKDRYKGGHKAWMAEVDATPLDSITPERVRAWKKDYANRAGRDELARRRLVVNVNSYLRRARALFSGRKVLDKLRSVRLPAILPFDGVELEKRTDTKFYGAGAEPVNLLRAAINELASDRVEELKAFLLGINLGLRRKEIDLLEWQSFDFVAGTVRILPTRWYALKTNESAAELPLEPEILELFRGWRARATGQFVIESDRPPQPPRPVDYDYYRCEPTFKALVEWLRSKGVQGNKPLHALRKLYGSALADLHGLHAASSGLRHADIRTTSGFYADRRVRVTPGFGSVISGAPVSPLPERPRLEKPSDHQKQVPEKRVL